MAAVTEGRARTEWAAPGLYPPSAFAESKAPFPWLALGLVLLAALAVRLVGIDHSPHFDEFYHLLAASSLVEDGDMCLYQCVSEYDRGAPFTYLVAGAFAVFGQHLLAARAVSVLAGLLLVAAMFWFGWRLAGPVAAWTGALLFALTPEAIYISQFVRFYAWHALLIFGGAVALYFAVHPPRRPAGLVRRGLLVAGAGAAFLLALQLQITTAIAVASLGVWLLLDPIADWALREWKRRPVRVVIAAVAALAVAAIAAFVAVRSGLAADLWSRYRSQNYFEARADDGIRYYHQFMLSSYTTFYTLFPVAFLVALWRWKAAALFCASVFFAGLVAHSGGGFKEPRFIFWAYPFFFILWGLALAVVLPALVAWARKGAAEWLGTPAASRVSGGLAIILVGAAAVFVLGTSAGYNTSIKMLTLTDAEWPAAKPHYRGRPEWRPAIPAVRQLAEDAEVVVTTDAIKAIWYLGRVDGEIFTGRLFTEDGLHPDFAVDPRLGTPVFRTPESLAQVMGCYASGLAVIADHAWAKEWGIPPETAAYLATHAEEVSLPQGSDLRVFRWRGAEAAGPACEPPPLERTGPPWASR